MPASSLLPRLLRWLARNRGSAIAPADAMEPSAPGRGRTIELEDDEDDFAEMQFQGTIEEPVDIGELRENAIGSNCGQFVTRLDTERELVSRPALAGEAYTVPAVGGSGQ